MKYFLLYICIPLFLFSAEYTQIDNKENSFKITLPATWNISKAKKSKDVLQLTAISPDRKKIVQVYHISINGDINVNKFATYFSRKLSQLGKVTDKNEVSNFFSSSPSYIELSHARNKLGYYTRSRYLASYVNGYAIILYNKVDDFSSMSGYVDSFKIATMAGAGSSFLYKFTDAIIEKVMKYWWLFVASIAIVVLVYLNDLRIKMLARTKKMKKKGKKELLYAPSDAVVWKILLSENDEVSSGQALLVLEEENGLLVNIIASVDGVVSSISVVENESVKANDILVELN